MVNQNSLNNLKLYSKDNQPKNKNGRKPSKLKKYIKDNEIGRDDVSLIIKNILFSKSYDELVEMVRSTSEPMIVRLLVKAYLEDFKKGGLVNFSVLMDRAFGSPKQDVKVDNEITSVTMTYKEREEKINEYIAKRNQGNMQGSGKLADRQNNGVPGEPEKNI